MLAAARTVVLLGILLQFAGFVRLLLIADYFGAGTILDAYYLGLIIPTFLTAISTTILQTSFVPSYVNAKAHGDDARARALANATLTWVTVTLAAISILLISAQGVAVPLLARDTNPATHAALRSGFALLVWSGPLNAAADAAALLLNAEGRFGAAACAPLANALAGVLVLVAFRARGMDALVWSLLAGLIVQWIVVLGAIRVARIPLRPQFVVRGGFSSVFGAVVLPVLLGVAIGNLLPAFLQLLSARAGTGAISAMGYATRLHNSLVQAVVLSASMVLLPQFARLVATGNEAELRNKLERLFAATLLFAAAATVLVATGGQSAIKLLLERGSFTAADVRLVASVWLALTVGLLGMTWNVFLFRLLQARQRAWDILRVNCVLVTVGVTLAALLLRWGVVGVAAANSVAYLLIAWILHRGAAGALGGSVLSAGAWRFGVAAILANLAAGILAVGWGLLVAAAGPLSVISGQVLIVSLANLLVVRRPPLNLPIRALLHW